MAIAIIGRMGEGRIRSWVPRLALGLLFVMGCDAEDESQDATKCRDDKADYNQNACLACPGRPCTGDGVVCTDNPHNLGTPSSVECRCDEGYVICCEERFDGVHCK